MHPRGVTGKFDERFFFAAKLNQINAPSDHFFRNASGLGFFDVAEINNPVEPAFVERPHDARAKSKRPAASAVLSGFSFTNTT